MFVQPQHEANLICSSQKVALDAFTARSVLHRLVSSHWQLRARSISLSIMRDLAVSLSLPEIAHSSAAVPYYAHTHSPKCMKLIHTVTNICGWDQQEVPTRSWKCPLSSVCADLIRHVIRPLSISPPNAFKRPISVFFQLLFSTSYPNYARHRNHVTANHLFSGHWYASASKASQA